MNKIKYYLLPGLISLTLWACESYFDDFKYDKKNSKIVVNAILQPDSLIRVNVCSSKTYNPPLASKILTNATVTLYKDGESLGNLIYTEEGNYILPNLYPFSGSTYKIEVVAEGYKSVWAETKIPTPAPITNVNISTVKKRSDPDCTSCSPETMIQYLVTLDISQTQSSWFSTAISLRQYNILYDDYECVPRQIKTEDGITTYDSCFYNTIDTIGFYNSYPKIISDSRFVKFIKADGEYEIGDNTEIDKSGNKFYLSAEHSNATEITFDLYLPEWNLDNNNNNEAAIWADWYDEALYKFFYSKAQDYETDEDPFAEKVSIYSNVNNGLGLFGSASSVSYLIKNE
jgi:hypothetical protein